MILSTCLAKLKYLKSIYFLFIHSVRLATNKLFTLTASKKFESTSKKI